MLSSGRFLFWVSVFIVVFLSKFSVLLADDICSSVMYSVYKLEGKAKNGEPISGTCFLISSKSGNGKKKFLVTAAHVIEQINGNFARLNLRKKTTNGFVKFQCRIQIRDGSRRYWICSEGSDLALIKVELPDDMTISTLERSEIARDSDFSSLSLSPGDKVFVAGFPYGCESSSEGFPILRSGIIASFVEAQSSGLKSYMVDFEVFQGYSGSPVFIEKNGRKFIIGVVTDEVFLEELRLKGKKTHSTKRGLGIAKACFTGELERLFNCY